VLSELEIDFLNFNIQGCKLITSEHKHLSLKSCVNILCSLLLYAMRSGRPVFLKQ